MKKAEIKPPTLSTCNGKDTKYQNETQIIFNYLQTNIATASMITATTGIVQKNICRYKRELEKMGLLWEMYNAPCKITGFEAAYLTTNHDLIPATSYRQLSLFSESEVCYE
jgi:hypothetical protein